MRGYSIKFSVRLIIWIAFGDVGWDSAGSTPREMEARIDIGPHRPESKQLFQLVGLIGSIESVQLHEDDQVSLLTAP